MQMIKAIIVEDEPNIAQVLLQILRTHFADIEIVGTAHSVSTAITLVKVLQPDLIFMDIEINEGTGFDVVKSTEEYNYELIFVTSYDQYALDAIKASALDYILKPLAIDDLKDAVERYRERINHLALNSHEAHLFIEGPVRKEKVHPEAIEYVEIKKGRCIFHLTDGKYIHCLQAVTTYQNEFPEYFYKAHRQFFVNTHHIQSIDYGRGGNVILKSGKEIKVAYRKKKELDKVWRGRPN